MNMIDVSGRCGEHVSRKRMGGVERRNPLSWQLIQCSRLCVCVCVCVCVKEGIFIKSLKFHSIAINKYGTRPPSHSL